jgi:hypothetical protein
MQHQTDKNLKNKLAHYMRTGCDERIYLDEKGVTRYGINPLAYQGRVNRGSCTCGSFNEENEAAMYELLSRNLEEKENYEKLLKEQTAELKKLLNYPGEDKFEIFYGASGTDLVYFPIIFSTILYPDKPILNILSCPEELGSGTLFAVRGEFHANFNQFEEPVPRGQKVCPCFNIKVLHLDARDTDGNIINHEAYIAEQIERHPNYAIIGSLVHGSKSGIQDNLEMMDRFNRKDIIWNVDLCQFRHDLSTIHNILDKNGCVMITGSKFYQAPPFCGALLVHKDMMKSLENGNFTVVPMFKDMMSAYDFPESMREKTALPYRQNIGLHLRWACFLQERTKFQEIPEDEVNEIIDRWNDLIRKILEANDEFELMPDQFRTNKTIISFRIKKDGHFFNNEELTRLFKSIVSDSFSHKYDFDKVFMGQPVVYGDKSFLRLAIGSMNIRKFHEDDEKEFKNDLDLIQIIKDKISSFETAR